MPRVRVNVVTGLFDTPERAQPFAVNVAQPAAFSSACVACHDQDVIEQQRLTRAQWDLEINKMIGWGAKVREEDRGGLLDYLSSNFGPRPR